MLNAIMNEKESDTAGPRTGKRKRYKRPIMPAVREKAPAEMMLILFLKKEKAAPMLNPNSPVVKGKIISSLGMRRKSSPIVSK